MDPSPAEEQAAWSHPARHLGDVGNVLGLLLAGFTGVVNMVGLRSAEMTTLLRNHGILVGLASALLLGSLICAITSIFAEKVYRIHIWISAAVIALLLAVAAFSIYVVRIPKTGTELRPWLLGGGLVMAAAAVGLTVAWLHRRPSRPTVSLQYTLLIASAILLSSATTAIVRIEARNQAVTSLPQLEASASMNTDGVGEVRATVSATKLRDSELVFLEVYGFPRGGSSEDPFRPCEGGGCDFISDVDIYPDSFGNIGKRDFTIPFSTLEYEHLTLFVSICESPEAREECKFGDKNTSLDLRLA